MIKIWKPLVLPTLLLCLSPFANIPASAQDSIQMPAKARPVPNAQLAGKELNAKVEKLLKQMTLEEKIGQTVQYSAGFATGPAGAKVSYDELTKEGKVGSMLNVYGADKTNHFQHIAMEQSRLHIPLLFGMDVIHGDHTTFPVPLGLAASWDANLIEGVARTSAVEARADGLSWVFSPMVDIARDARWGRIVESSGEDPYLGSAIARGWVKGYQQGDLGKPDSVAVSVKHFAAYGAAIAGRDYNAVDMSDITLRQVYLPAYHAAVDAGAATMMSSFNSLNGVPATANPYLMTQILRKEWGFDGMVVSDWGAVGELLNHSIGPDGATVARKALVAGVDMDMESNLYGTTIAAQVRSGAIPEAVVDEAARRILRVKFALGLFERPYTDVTPAYEPTVPKRAQARAVAAETIVLLKNDATDGTPAPLPLSKNLKTVALIGPLADSAKDMLGSWGALGEAKNAVSLRQALSERLGDRLVYSVGCGVLSGKDELVLHHVSFVDDGKGQTAAEEPIPDDTKTIAEAVETAKKADVAILALGESADWMTGEASSRTHLTLPGRQEELLEAVEATGKPVVLILFTGRPSEIKWAGEHVPAIVEAWFPGMEGGHAVADVLFGDVNPSGKLPVSFPRATGQEPLYYAQLPTGRPAHVDLSHLPTNSIEKFVSRYLDEDNSALFPFGWGLSYTKFSYSKPTVSRAQVALKEVIDLHQPTVTVGVDVRNTGSLAGTETVQLYVRNTSASVEQPVRELKGFNRVTLEPGESKHVEFPLTFDELSFYNVESKRVVEPTTYKVFVGGSSLATGEASFEVK